MEPELLAALIDARECIADWGNYASDYFREKHDLAGDLARLDAMIEKAKQAGVVASDLE